MSPWGFVVLAYAILGAVAAWLAENVRGHSAVTMTNSVLGWSSVGGAHLFSGLLGAVVGAFVIVTTRVMVRHLRFATRLHSELRPLAVGLSTTTLWLLAISSSFGEELLFRGLLLPWIGLVPQAILFGILHQTGGGSRWVWMAWATLMGVILGGVYTLTGSLVGPLLAHATINFVNLHFLKSYNPEGQVRGLGGLLGHPRS